MRFDVAEIENLVSFECFTAAERGGNPGKFRILASGTLLGGCFQNFLGDRTIEPDLGKSQHRLLVSRHPLHALALNIAAAKVETIARTRASGHPEFKDAAH